MAPIGTWRSLVARTVRDREVAGSNPVVPTRNRRSEAQSPLTFSVILATNWPQVATNGTSKLGKRGLFSRTTRANPFGMFREADGAGYQGILRPSSAPFLSTRCPKTKLFAHDTTDCRNGVQADEQRCRNRQERPRTGPPAPKVQGGLRQACPHQVEQAGRGGLARRAWRGALPPGRQEQDLPPSRRREAVLHAHGQKGAHQEG